MTSPPERPIRVLVADDDERQRSFLTALIRGEPSLELVATACDAPEALALAARHRPDVAVLDVEMPGGGGPEAARAIHAVSPATRIVAFSAHEDRGAVLEMVQSGMTGYVVKGAPAREIVATIEAGARGRSTLSGAVATGVIEELAERLQSQRHEDERLERRTAQVQRVLAGVGLEMVYQPIVELERGRLAGCEALARFEGGEAPDVCFAEAGEVGLGVELELAAVRAAVAGAGRLARGSYLSVNVSPASATSSRLAGALAGIAVDRVVLELTEHARIDDYDRLNAALAPLRERGARIAVDDVGAGFASLRHIVLLDPDIIKLDTGLTAGIDREHKLRALASALIAFARETQATIVAEGIESENQLAVLRELGVRCGQGYYLGRPAPADALERWRAA